MAQRTAALEQMHASILGARREIALQDRLAAIGELASVFAHEVRTPLNALSIANQRMSRALRRQGNLDPDMAAEILADQAGNVDVISEYVKRYLGLARRAEEAADSFAAADLFDEVFRLVHGPAAAAGVRLAAWTPPDVGSVKLRRGTLRHIMLNLVSNAIQVQPDGGEVEVAASRVNGSLLIEVRDRGPGIPPERAETVFKPFQSWREGGTGLGLSISRRFAADLGGTLAYEPRDGGGSVFALQIPLEKSQEQTTDDKAENPAAAHDRGQP